MKNPNQMTKTVTIKDWVLVECPKDYWSFHINEDGDIEAYPEDGGGGIKPIKWNFYKFDLPPGNYQIIRLAKDLDESQWKEIVDSFPLVENGQVNHYYPDFISTYKTKTNPFVNATASGHSLFKSNSMELSITLILKKVL